MAKKVFQPLNERVLVSPIEDEQGKIINPVKEKPTRGKVLRSASALAKPGDVVFWSKFSGVDFSIEDQGFVLIEGKELLGIIKA